MSKEKPKFDREAFKRAIAMIESQGGKLLDNPGSSAAGRYHFLYRYIKDTPLLKGVSKREFINRPELQEKVMDMAIDGTLPGFPSYEKNSNKLKAKYNTNLRTDEIAALTHFLGRGGVEKFLSSPKDFTVPGNNNASVTQYVDRFNKAQGTESSYVSNPRRNFVDTQSLMPPSVSGDIQGVTQGKGFQFTEVESTPEIYSSPNESFDLKAFNEAMQQDESVDPANRELISSVIPGDESIEQQGIRLSKHLENSNKFAMGGMVDPPGKRRVKMNDPNRPPASELNDGSGIANVTQMHSDIQWKANRDAAYKASFDEWRQGKTGNVRNDNFTQVSPEYREFWDNTKADYLKSNPRPLINEYAGGGEMQGGSPGEFTEFEGGGTHEQNPLGGIPQGMGANGKMNTVEEGESKYAFDDGEYIFSNRITL